MSRRSSRVGSRLSVAAVVLALVGALLTSGSPATAAVGTGTIQGTVSSAAPGFDPGTIWVGAYRKSTSSSGFSRGDLFPVNANGSYSIPNLPPDNYRLVFSSNSNVVQTEYWNNSLTLEDAADIPVAAEQVVTGKDAVLEREFAAVGARWISGNYNAGQPLRADPGLSPAPTDFSAEWFVDGTKVAGADQATFVPTESQVGRVVSARVTGYRAGFNPKTITIEGYKVKPGAPTGFSVATTSDTGRFEWTPQPYYSYYLSLTTRTRTYDNVLVQPGYRIGGLDPSRTYTARVVAVSSTLRSEPGLVTFTTAPMPRPTKLEIYARKRTSVGIQWRDVPGAGSFTATYRSKGKKAKTKKMGIGGSTLRGLKPGTKYTVQITALAKDGLTKSTSKPITIKTRK